VAYLGEGVNSVNIRYTSALATIIGIALTGFPAQQAEVQARESLSRYDIDHAISLAETARKKRKLKSVTVVEPQGQASRAKPMSRSAAGDAPPRGPEEKKPATIFDLFKADKAVVGVKTKTRLDGKTAAVVTDRGQPKRLAKGAARRAQIKKRLAKEAARRAENKSYTVFDLFERQREAERQRLAAESAAKQQQAEAERKAEEAALALERQRQPEKAEGEPSTENRKLASVDSELADEPVSVKPRNQSSIKLATKAVASDENSKSCNKAKSIIGKYAFADIEAISCKGKVYRFSATRNGKKFSIKISAVTWELIEIAKVLSRASRSN
jgi:hypothetical protein